MSGRKSFRGRLHPDGRTIATSGQEGNVMLWDLRTGHQLGAAWSGMPAASVYCRPEYWEVGAHADRQQPAALNDAELHALGPLTMGELAGRLRRNLAGLRTQLQGYGQLAATFRFHGGRPVTADLALGSRSPNWSSTGHTSAAFWASPGRSTRPRRADLPGPGPDRPALVDTARTRGLP